MLPRPSAQVLNKHGGALAQRPYRVWGGARQASGRGCVDHGGPGVVVGEHAVRGRGGRGTAGDRGRRGEGGAEARGMGAATGK